MSRTIPLTMPPRGELGALDPFALADSSDPLLWWRDGDWMVGNGRLATLEFSGEKRFADAAKTWKEIQARTPIEIRAQVRGFATFAFADESAAPSVIVIPKLLIGFTHGQHWACLVQEASESEISDEDIAAAVAQLVEESQRDGQKARSNIQLRSTDAVKERHQKAVSATLDLIAADKLQKVVIAREACADVGLDFDIRETLRNLAQTYPTCWVFAVDGFFGASPETLLESHGGTLHARVLAGTQRRGDGGGPTALLSDTKEISEHAFAVQSVVAALETSAAHAKTDGPFILELANVRHLATDVNVGAKDRDLLEVLEKLHPTAAVAGVPREAALAAITALEREDRGRYAGPVGWLDLSDAGEWALGIRSAQYQRDRVVAWAGGGIVAGSEPQHEFAETEAKLAPIADALQGM